MVKAFILLGIFLLNLYVLNKFRALSRVAAGIDFTLTGAFLAGYWFGFKTGFYIGLLFMLSYYAMTLDFGMHTIINTVLCGIVGLIGAFAFQSGIQAKIAGIATVIIFCLLSDSISLWIGERDFFSLFMFDAGAILFNFIIFRIFF
ncbi:MAG: hypothetical protein ABIG95_01475 [Candidatus Woesearchaeota archaeon]